MLTSAVDHGFSAADDRALASDPSSKYCTPIHASRSWLLTPASGLRPSNSKSKQFCRQLLIGQRFAAHKHNKIKQLICSLEVDSSRLRILKQIWPISSALSALLHKGDLERGSAA